MTITSNSIYFIPTLWLWLFFLCQSQRSVSVSPSGDCNVQSFMNKTREIDFQKLKNRPCDFLLDFQGPGSRLTTPEIAAVYGLKMEKHHVTTEDGYILELHRIPANENKNKNDGSGGGKPPVLLFSGLTMSSREFFLNCDRRALGVRLADENFDVWLGNTRGSTYSLSHVNGSMSRDKAVFWDFGMDEVVQYDAPAIVDYILNKTGHGQLSWIGYSLGPQVMLGLLATRPEYNAKVNVGLAVAPSGFFTKIRSWVLRRMVRFVKKIERTVTRFHHGELMPRFLAPIFHRAGPFLCRPNRLTGKNRLCAFVLYLVDGHDPDQIDARVLATVLGRLPGPSSVRMLTQVVQSVARGVFDYYDFGKAENLKKYGQPKPPSYDLTKVTSPVVHFWAPNDYYTVPLDIKNKDDRGPPNLTRIKVKSLTWNHLAWVFGKDVDVYVYDQLVEILNGCGGGSAGGEGEE